MFCHQCEQTPEGGCTVRGVCGKTADLASLQDNLIFALKGIAAYAYHAAELGYRSPEVDAFMHEALFATLTNVDFSEARFLALNLKAGEMNLKVMELLDRANVETFGQPQVVEVATGTRSGPGILVTGHDMGHLRALLEQSEGRGVNIYTHGEMLSAHGYPALKRHPHLAGNLGGSWVQQRDLFAGFPGAILGTTNCVLPPRGRYEDRMFTSGIAGLDGVTHIEGEDFGPVIARALELPPLGASGNGAKLTVGFHHSNVLALAPQILEAVKAGKLRRFFLVAGCDCPGRGMEYYQELTRLIPQDCLILTLACGKYRYNAADYGTTCGLPRFIDLGQCNNAYSAVRIAAALSEATGLGLNELPLSIVASWFEQKAVAILLSLLHLGLKGIRLGPKPPAWITPGVFKALQEGFDLKLIGDPAADLEAMLSGN